MSEPIREPGPAIPHPALPDPETRVALDSLIASYGDAVNRRDAESWAACWADDAVWQLRTMELSGKPQIVAGWRKAMDNFAHVWFMAFVGHVEMTGSDEARLRTHTFEYLCPVGGAPKLQSGLYEDRVIRQDGRWVFACRIFSSQELPL